MATDALTADGSDVLRLRPGVFRAVDRGGREYLLARSASERLGKLTRMQRDVLHRLADTECSGAALAAMARAGGGEAGVAAVGSLLRQLRVGGWLSITVVADDRPAYTVQPHRRPGPVPERRQVDVVLSRFAVLRRSDADLVIESPRSWCSVVLHDPSVIGALAAVALPPDKANPGQAPGPLADRLVFDLTWASMVVEVAGDEDCAFELLQWSPHELWFHMRSRAQGVPDGHFGRTGWAAGRFEPLPARRVPSSDRRIELLRPDLGALRREDATLTSALEERRSIRRHDDKHPITLRQVGEFLYRAAGVRSLMSETGTETGTGTGAETVTGPNPSGGALDELEFYLAVRLAEGLDPGLYRYDRFDHWLEHVSGWTRATGRLIDAAQNATGGSHVPARTYPPQLVVLLAARFGRVGWGYEALAYSLILKHVGVTFQTMYCVATAMGLAPCALGAGDPAVFAEATGLDPLVEGTVGEFILGSRLATEAGRRGGAAT